MAKTIMLQGTSSNVGKSILVTALCRIFKQDGYKVVPFKSQNMALNSFVTKDGGEMGRAQAVQAQAAGLEPSVEMNPILLKPTGQAASQVIVLGKPVSHMGAKEYHLNFNTKALDVISDCLAKFHREYEIIVIEGAGSPVEVNLKPRDIANMKIAKMADAPVLLVADIDRGGAIASIVGTLELLDPDERDRVAGIIINKFRGDLELLRPALDFIETKTGKPVLGVVPYLDFSIPDEDSVALEGKRYQALKNSEDKLDIAVIRLPYISNFTDFDALSLEADVSLRYVVNPEDLGKPDLIIIPGSKNPLGDINHLFKSGLAHAIQEAHRAEVPVMGLGSGYQILGEQLYTESHSDSLPGLGLLPMETYFQEESTTTQVEGEVCGSGIFLTPCQGQKILGYEIYTGRTIFKEDLAPAFLLTSRGGEKCEEYEGASNEKGNVWGTYIHGLFDNDAFRRTFLNVIRSKKGWQPIDASTASYALQLEKDIEKLAEVVRSSLRMDLLYQIMNLERSE